jgi:hypothetical protein
LKAVQHKLHLPDTSPSPVITPPNVLLNLFQDPTR